jgi:hypothetical protein
MAKRAPPSRIGVPDSTTQRSRNSFRRAVMAGSVWQTTPNTPHRGRRTPLKLATKTRSHPRATKRSSPSPGPSRRVTRGKSKRKASTGTLDALLAGWREHRLSRHPEVLRVVLMIIDSPRLRSPLRPHPSARSHSHHLRTTRSRVLWPRSTCRWCHSVSHRIGGILPVGDMPLHRPHS